MITWPRARVIIGSILILVGATGVFGFRLWRYALAGLSPDGVIMDYSWLVLRIMMMALIAPGIVLLATKPLRRLVLRCHHWLGSFPTSAFLVYALVGAALLRVIVVLILPMRLTSDFLVYHELALKWNVYGEYTDGTYPTAYFPPGWPFFLSRLYAVFGPDPNGGIVANLIFGVGIVYLIWRLVRQIWSEMPARWAAILTAVLPSELLYTNILGSEGLFTLLLLAALLLLLPRIDRGRIFWLSPAVGGILLGLATLTRTLSFLLPLVLLPVYLVRPGVTKRTLIHWGVGVLGLLIITVPWMMRNEARLGRATLSTNTGVNLYIGNNAMSGVGFNKPSTEILLLRSARDEVHDDSVGFTLGMQYILSHPLAFLVRGCLKSAYFLLCDVDGLFYELGKATDAAAFDRYCWLALLTQGAWFVFMLAATIGMAHFVVSTAGRDPWGLSLLVCTVYWIAVHFVFFGTGRFHMPIVPLIAAFAGLTIAKIGERQVSDPAGAIYHS